MRQQQVVDNLACRNPARGGSTAPAPAAPASPHPAITTRPETQTLPAHPPAGLGNDIDVASRFRSDIHAEINHRVDHASAVTRSSPAAGSGNPGGSGQSLPAGCSCRWCCWQNADRAVVLAEQLLDFNSLLQQRQRARVKQAAMFVDHQSLPYPVKQLDAQLAFGSVNAALTADCERQHL